MGRILNEGVISPVVNMGEYLSVMDRGMRMDSSMNLVLNRGANSDDSTYSSFLRTIRLIPEAYVVEDRRSEPGSRYIYLPR